MSEVSFYSQGKPLMEAAFASFIQWAWRDPETRAAFEADTGKKIATTSIDLMVDQATGYDKEVASEFVEWAITNLWGLEEEGRW